MKQEKFSDKDFDHKLIIEKYNELKTEHPEFDERKLLEEVFSRISKDFQDDSYLERLTEDVYVDGHAHIIYPLKDLTDEQIQALFNACDELRKAGVYFDTGYNIETNEREWHIDWSLRGAKVKVESLDEFKKWKKKNDFQEDLKRKYYCNICKSHHFYDSEKGKEHLLQSQKTLKVYKLDPEKEKEITERFKATQKKFQERMKLEREKEESKKEIDKFEYEDKKMQEEIDNEYLNFEQIIEKRIQADEEHIEYMKIGIIKQKKIIKENLEDSLEYKNAIENLKDFKESLKLTKRSIADLDAHLENKLPQRFILQSLNITKNSLRQKDNIEFVKQTQKEYEMIPARFRDPNRSAPIYFYFSVNGHKDIQFLHFGTGGVCIVKGGQRGTSYHHPEIVIASNGKVREEYIEQGGSVIAHEKGHEVYFNMLNEHPEYIDEFNELTKFKSGDTRRLPNEWLGIERNRELFADYFMEWTTGKRWHNYSDFHKKPYTELMPELVPLFEKMIGKPRNKHVYDMLIRDDIEERYLIRLAYTKEIEDKIIFVDGFFKVPEDISYEEAEELINSNKATITETDFSFPESMQRSIGEGKIVKSKQKNAKKVKRCSVCKKEVDSYFYESKKNQKLKLCEECYLKREKNYIEKYDLQEDYPIQGHTREEGKVKVKAHTRGEDKKIEVQYYDSFVGKWKIHQLGSFHSLEEAKKEAQRFRNRIEKKNIKIEGRPLRKGIGSDYIPPLRIKSGNNYYPATQFDKEQYKKHKEQYEKADLQEDYPVEGYERTSKTGVKHQVKKHERGKEVKIDEKWIKLYNLDMDSEEYNHYKKLYENLMDEHKKVIKDIKENKIPKWEKEMDDSFTEEELKSIDSHIEAPKYSERWNAMSALQDFEELAIKPHCWDCKYLGGKNWCKFKERFVVPSNFPCSDFELQSWDIKKIKKAPEDIRKYISKYEDAIIKLEESFEPQKYKKYIYDKERKKWLEWEKEQKEFNIIHEKRAKEHALWEKQQLRKKKIDDKARDQYWKAWREINLGDAPYDYEGAKITFKRYLKILKDLEYTGRAKIIEEEILDLDKLKQERANKIKIEKEKEKQRLIEKERGKQKQERLSKLKEKYGKHVNLDDVIKFYKDKYKVNPIQRGSVTKVFRKFLYERKGIPRSLLDDNSLFKLKKEYRHINSNTLDFTKDYPIGGYERTSKRGVKHKVKPHERGTNIIKNEQLKERITKYEEASKRHKEKIKKLEKKPLKVNKIVTRKEYHEECSICNRKLKKAVFTEKGVMGYRCYLTQIGVPTRKQQLSIKDLPDETFEGVAESVGEIIEKLDPKEVIKAYFGDTEFKHPPRYTSKIRFLYYRKYDNKWKEINILTDSRKMVLSKLLDMPSEILDRVLKTETMNQFFYKHRLNEHESIQINMNEDFVLIEDLKNKYYCHYCERNHYFDSDVGKEHILISKKTLEWREKQKKEKLKEKEEKREPEKEKKEKGWYEKGRLYNFENVENIKDVMMEANTDYLYHGSNIAPDIILKEGLKTKPAYFRKPNEDIGKDYNVVFLTPRKDIAVLHGEYLYKIDAKKIHSYKVMNDPDSYDSVGILKNIPSNVLLYEKGKLLDMILSDMAIEYEEKRTTILFKTILHDGKIERIEFDEAIRRVESKIPSGQTRLQKLWEQQKLYEEAYRHAKQLGISPTISPVASITVPFSITNTQTGKVMKGEVVENLDKNIIQLTPISSSNVRAAGQFKSELLVQFHPAKLQPMRTYRYMFETPEHAEEAYHSLMETGSPGRWVWQNLRGHVAGESITSTKIGPSLSPPGQGLPTIGGTSASLVAYKISNRVPVSRVKNFDEILKEMKRTMPNVISDPSTGSRIEGLMGARKELRELQTPGWRKGTHGLPPIGDFVYVGNVNELEKDYKVRGHWRNLKSGKKVWVKEHTRGEEKVQEKEKIPLWKKIKEFRKEHSKLEKEIDKYYSRGKSWQVPLDDRERLKFLKEQLKIPKRKRIKQTIKQLEDTLKWAKKTKEMDKKEIEREQQLEEVKGYKPNYTDYEWLILLEQYQNWDERISGIEEKLKETRESLKKVDIFESELFEDKETIDYYFDKPLHKKIKIQKDIMSEEYGKRLIYGEKINIANNTFYDLPKNLQESCSQSRIFEKATDDPSFGSLKGCGGFYDPIDQTITIGLKTHRKSVFAYSNKFIKESIIHEAAHALDFTKLYYDEKEQLTDFFGQNYNRLKKRGEYASTNVLEFFAEGYTKLYTENHAWFRGLTKGTKGLFQNILKKYDFISNFTLISPNEKMNGIKFSYWNDDGIHVFGFYSIPEDISQAETELLVEEGKAQFENINKYIEKIKEKEEV